MTKILILEDEKILLKLYEKQLTKQGHIVKCCINVDEAEKVIENFTPEISLIDHGIKHEEKSGIDFIPKLRKKSKTQKIIVLSNFSDTILKDQAMKKGADSYLTKINASPKNICKIIENLT